MENGSSKKKKTESDSSKNLVDIAMEMVRYIDEKDAQNKRNGEEK